ncbi:hypothetical protein THAOC_20211 [Thalassiosira oceanica]|uniref:Uncharacterized protein n=1 Tax=Thalassiosira oceanica TaxID=159749 RepID=K0SM68_THAOC|nr:hypothetical protein THAOC_20211 [Thalassiosira oceanica]|eukprot:EJK59547.1 hypothetical protein THAOC_20211 [Thalassiosira oceanica]
MQPGLSSRKLLGTIHDHAGRPRPDLGEGPEGGSLPGKRLLTRSYGIPLAPPEAATKERNTNLENCHYNDIGFDYTLSPPPPPSSIDPTTDIQQQLSANAERCHQRAERGNYRRGGDTVDDADLSLPDPPSSKDLGELYIGEINRANRLLLPVSIGPYGDFGPIFRNFLFGQGPRQPLSPFKDRPQANLAHLRATSHPAPFDVITTACTNWKRNKSRHFFVAILTRHPPRSPREHFLQKFGLHTTKALAVLLHNSFKHIVSMDPARDGGGGVRGGVIAASATAEGAHETTASRGPQGAASTAVAIAELKTRGTGELDANEAGGGDVVYDRTTTAVHEAMAEAQGEYLATTAASESPGELQTPRRQRTARTQEETATNTRRSIPLASSAVLTVREGDARRSSTPRHGWISAARACMLSATRRRVEFLSSTAELSPPTARHKGAATACDPKKLAHPGDGGRAPSRRVSSHTSRALINVNGAQGGENERDDTSGAMRSSRMGSSRM